MGKPVEAVLLLTHFLDDRICAGYRRLRDEAGNRDVYVLFNKTDDNNPGYPPPPDVRVFAFTEADLQRLGYPRKGRYIRDADIDLFSVTFRRQHPQYERIWIIEYDVDFTERWSVLFDAFAASDADLLATSIHRHAVNPGWDNWSAVFPPQGRLDNNQLIRAFLPLSRLSARAYAAMDEAYRDGWSGHYECLLPTMLMLKGLKIEDIGGDGEFVAAGNRNRFYTSTPSSNDLSPGSFVFRPVRHAAGSQPAKLWHPVKPPSTRYVRGWRTGRMAIMKRRAMSAARQMATLSRRLLPAERDNPSTKTSN